MIRLCFTTLLISTFISVCSQSNNDTTAQALTAKTIAEVTVHAPIAIYSKLKWPGGYSLLSAQSIQSGNSYLLSEQLNTVPGIFMQQGTLSTNRITIRGIGSRTPYNTNRIKAYWGEMPLTDAEGVTSIEDLGLNDINSIQVVKGPSSSLYGSGMGGAILIDPFNFTKDKPKVMYKGEMGRYSTYSNSVDVHLSQSPKRKVSLVMSSLNSQGYRENSAYKRYNATLKGQQKFGASYLNYLYNYRYLNGQIPSSIDSVDFVNEPHKAADSWKNIQGFEESSRHLVSIGLVTPYQSKWLNSFTVFGGYTAFNELRPFNELNDSRATLGFREKLSYIGTRIRAQLGVEYVHEKYDASLFEVDEEVKGNFISNNKQVNSYYNVFGWVDWDVTHQLTWQVSLNLNQTKYHILSSKYYAGADTYKYAPILSPRMGVNYAIFKSSYLFASLGHGFSAPSVQETQLPDNTFNASIKPEEGMNYEVGFRSNTFNNRLFVDVTLYAMQMKNLLVTKRESDDIFYGVNAGKTTHKGIEATATYSLISGIPSKALELSVNYFASENKFKEFVDEGQNYSGNHLPGIPTYNMGVNVYGRLKQMDLHVNYKMVGSQYLTDGNTNTYQKYGKVGAKLVYNVGHKSPKGNIYLGVDNLFDTHYASMVLINAPSFGHALPRYYYPGLPFNLYAGIQFQF